MCRFYVALERYFTPGSIRVDTGHKNAVQSGSRSLLGLPNNQRGQVSVDDASIYLRLRFS